MSGGYVLVSVCVGVSVCGVSVRVSLCQYVCVRVRVCAGVCQCAYMCQCVSLCVRVAISVHGQYMLVYVSACASL